MTRANWLLCLSMIFSLSTSSFAGNKDDCQFSFFGASITGLENAPDHVKKVIVDSLPALQVLQSIGTPNCEIPIAKGGEKLCVSFAPGISVGLLANAGHSEWQLILPSSKRTPAQPELIHTDKGPAENVEIKQDESSEKELPPGEDDKTKLKMITEMQLERPARISHENIAIINDLLNTLEIVESRLNNKPNRIDVKIALIEIRGSIGKTMAQLIEDPKLASSVKNFERGFDYGGKAIGFYLKILENEVNQLKKSNALKISAAKEMEALMQLLEPTKEASQFQGVRFAHLTDLLQSRYQISGESLSVLTGLSLGQGKTHNYRRLMYLYELRALITASDADRKLAWQRNYASRADAIGVLFEKACERLCTSEEQLEKYYAISQLSEHNPKEYIAEVIRFFRTNLFQVNLIQMQIVFADFLREQGLLSVDYADLILEGLVQVNFWHQLEDASWSFGDQLFGHLLTLYRNVLEEPASYQTQKVVKHEHLGG